jgi:hypothetical protein
MKKRDDGKSERNSTEDKTNRTEEIEGKKGRQDKNAGKGKADLVMSVPLVPLCANLVRVRMSGGSGGRGRGGRGGRGGFRLLIGFALFNFLLLIFALVLVFAFAFAFVLVVNKQHVLLILSVV